MAGAINVALLDSLAPRLTRLIGHLEAGETAIRHIPSVPFFGKVDRLKAEALGGSEKAVALIQRDVLDRPLLDNLSVTCVRAHISR